MLAEAREYLEGVSKRFNGTVYRAAFLGNTLDQLTQLVKDWWITDIVMASHGRSGVSRIVMGSVADELVHRLHCHILVVPVHHTVAQSVTESDRQPAAAIR